MKSLVKFIAEAREDSFKEETTFTDFCELWADWLEYKMPNGEIEDNKFWKEFEKCEPQDIEGDEITARQLYDLYLNENVDHKIEVQVTYLDPEYDYRITDPKSPKGKYNMQFVFRANIFED